MNEGPSLQERYAPNNRCFGCGPANPQGLRIRSFPTRDDADADVVLEWTPGEQHEAYPGAVNGGIVGTLMDCHSNWAATWHLMKRDGLESPPCTVTAEYHVRFRRPTPVAGPLRLVARVKESWGNRVRVETTLTAGGELTATCMGTFVSVAPGHPAFHRW